MRIKEVGYIVERLADRFRDLGGQMAGQEAAHKAALTEIRASFNARTSADGKLIEGYRRQIVSLGAANDRLNDLLRAERLAHRDEVAALQERLRASIARGDFAQMEVAARTKQSELSSLRFIESAYNKALEWCKEGQTPDDRIRELYKERNEFREQLRAAKTAPKARPFPPEADHDTEAGKAVAESALKTEPVAKGDLVKVFQATGSMTVAEDIGSGGVVHKVDVDWVWLRRHYTMDLPRQGVASLSDVRKVTP